MAGLATAFGDTRDTYGGGEGYGANRNGVLTHLSLQMTEMGDEGLIALSRALRTNRALTWLELSYNSVSKQGVLALSRALTLPEEVDTTLARVYSGGGVGAGVGAGFPAGGNMAVQQLWFGSNPIGDAGARHFADMLRRNTGLHELGLNDNGLGLAGGVALRDALAQEKGGTNRDLYGCYTRGSDIYGDNVLELRYPEVVKAIEKAVLRNAQAARARGELAGADLEGSGWVNAEGPERGLVWGKTGERRGHILDLVEDLPPGTRWGHLPYGGLYNLDTGEPIIEEPWERPDPPPPPEPVEDSNATQPE